MIAEIDAVEAYLTLVLSWLLNGLLLWLISKRTPPAMRVYSLILAQTCVVDILLSTVSALLQPACLLSLL
jgi:uncharacterized membrane protein YvlD (DUF360 family)